MFDDNWEMISGKSAHRIEVLNHLSQINQIEAMVVYSLHHFRAPTGGCARHLNQAALRELHRTGTFLLLEKPGQFREREVELQLANGNVVHLPPQHEEVEPLLDRFFTLLSGRWEAYKAVEAAAFALWFINWVHPFVNGNGRTARAFCYATMVMKMGYVPGGEPAVPELIKRNDEEYQLGLRFADETYQSSGEPNLSRLEDLLDRLLADQLEQAIVASEG